MGFIAVQLVGANGSARPDSTSTGTDPFGNSVILDPTVTPIPNGTVLVFHKGGLGNNVDGLVDNGAYTAVVDANNPAYLHLKLAQVLVGTANGVVTQTFVVNSVDASNTTLTVSETAGTTVPQLTEGEVVTFYGTSGVAGSLQAGQSYTVHIISQNQNNQTSPNGIQLQLEASGVAVTDTTTGPLGNTVQLTMNEALVDSGGVSYHLVGANAYTHVVTVAAPSGVTPNLTVGQALTYHKVLTAYTGSLVDGVTYYIASVNETDPNNITLQLKDSSGNLLDIQSTVDLIEVDNVGMSGTAHTLVPVDHAGITISAKEGLPSGGNANDSGTAKSGIGSQPKIYDVLTKGEVANSSQLWNTFAMFLPGAKNLPEEQIKEGIGLGSTSSGPPFSISASLVVEDVTHTVIAEVGPDAIVRSLTSVTVASSLEDGEQTSDDATVSQPSTTKGKYDASRPLIIAAAVDIGLFANTSHALIDGGAQVDSGGSLSVTSEINYPFVWTIHNPDGFQPDEFFGAEGYHNLLVILNGKLGINDQLINNWADSGIKASESKVSISVSLALTIFNNSSLATIGSGALINQDSAYQDASQGVTVDASLNYDQVNFAGNIYIDLAPDNILKTERKEFAAGGKGYGGLAGTILAPTGANWAGIGASLGLQFMKDTTEASIGDSHTFDASQAVSGNSIDLGYDSGFTTGQEVIYQDNGGTDIGGLTSGHVYYVIEDPNSTNKIELASSYANALAGTAIPLSAGAGSDQSILAVNTTTPTFNGANVTPATNTINLGYNPGFSTGEGVVYDNGGGTSIGGLVSGQLYYAIVDPSSPDTLKLASSYANAIAGIAVPLTAAGAGTSQSFKGIATRVNFGNGGLTVNATKTMFDIAFATSGSPFGSSGAALGINGTVGYLGDISTTEALIQNGTFVTSDAGTTGDVEVTATDDSVAVVIAGAAINAQNFGVGFSVAINNLNRTTEAIIGSDVNGGSVAGNSTFDVGGSITVAATTTGTTLSLAVVASNVATPGPLGLQPLKDPPPRVESLPLLAPRTSRTTARFTVILAPPFPAMPPSRSIRTTCWRTSTMAVVSPPTA